MRESSIQSGVDFISHPNVIPRNKDEKISFLRSKGLTGEEIEEAFKRFESGRPQQQPPPSAIPTTQSPQIIYAPPPEETTSWTSYFAPLSLALSTGASMLYFYKHFINPDTGDFPWENSGLKPPPLFQDNTNLAPPPVLQQQQQGVTAGTQQLLPTQQATLPTNNNNIGWNPPSPFPLSQGPLLPHQQQQQQNNNTNNNNNNDIAQLKRSIEEQNNSIRELVTTLKEVSERNGLSSSKEENINIQTLMQAMNISSEVKAELSSIKTLLLANLVRGGGNNSSQQQDNNISTTDISQLINNLSSTLSPSKTSSVSLDSKKNMEEEQKPEEDEDARLLREGLEKSRQALGNFVNCANDNDDLLSAGCGMLLMFLKNILKEPHNPRYRRVAKTNANYKKNLEPLSGTLPFFESVGFDDRGSQMELKSGWVESLEKGPTGWAKGILEDAVANLETVREQRSVYPGDSTPPRKDSIENKMETSPHLKKTIRSAATIAALPTPTTVVSNNKQQQNNNSSNSNNNSNQTTETSTPTYPPSFADIIRMQQEGKKPDGIKDIPDRISADEPSKPVLTPIPKPWEVNKNNSKLEIHEIVDEQEQQLN